MEVSAKYEGQQLEFQLSGELDHHGAKGLLDCLEREIERTVPMSLVLDFSGVTFMDSSGVGLILGRSRRIAGLGGKLSVQNVSPAVKKMLDIARIPCVTGGDKP